VEAQRREVTVLDADDILLRSFLLSIFRKCSNDVTARKKEMFYILSSPYPIEVRLKCLIRIKPGNVCFLFLQHRIKD